MSQITSTLTRELYEPDINPGAARRLLQDFSDVSTTYDVARIFGNDSPRPPKKLFYDTSLRGTGTLAYHLDPQEVKQIYPTKGAILEKELGTEPIHAYNPDIVNFKNKEYAISVDHHEKAHGGQQGKLQLKKLHAFTQYGLIPVGLMLIEGGVEYALERRGIKPPTRYMDESSGKQSYSVYRDFVYELEGKQHGIMRQIYRAAAKAGPRAAGRLLEAVPEIDDVINKYAEKLNKLDNLKARV